MSLSDLHAVRNPGPDLGHSRLDRDVGTGSPITAGWGGVSSFLAQEKGLVLTRHGSCLFFRNLSARGFILLAGGGQD